MDKAMTLAPNFTLGEFFSRVINHRRVFDSASWNYFCGLPEVDQNLYLGRLKELAIRLQEIRDHFGKPVRINSGFRCPSVNLFAGGASDSCHLKGRAADIEIDGVPAYKVQAFLMAKDWKGGLGRYAGFTHVDIGLKRRW